MPSSLAHSGRDEVEGTETKMLKLKKWKIRKNIKYNKTTVKQSVKVDIYWIDFS